VGCPMRCLFCATGKMGFTRNLKAVEIVDQVLYFARLLKKENKTVTNIVFMGMGEPLLNLKEVLEAINIFTGPEKLGMSERKITISTCGVTPNLIELIKSDYKGRLALSLHAANQKLREKLMPITSKYPLPELLKVVKEFAEKTGKRVSYEYILIDGLNDKPEDAKTLSLLLGKYLTHVNLIPYNPVSGKDWKRSSKNSIKIFSDYLTAGDLEHTIRVTMGDDIGAACGQLAGK
ncbi:MAG: Ribosomal RNA large subunit methyltransferase N, partial [Candidatus Gottesmanbacteria bacterium GW2011_GWC2_39_8]